MDEETFLMAKYIMGWDQDQIDDAQWWNPRKSIAHSWMLIDKLQKSDCIIEVTNLRVHWNVTVQHVFHKYHCYASHENICDAICNSVNIYLEYIEDE